MVKKEWRKKCKEGILGQESWQKNQAKFPQKYFVAWLFLPRFMFLNIPNARNKNL